MREAAGPLPTQIRTLGTARVIYKARASTEKHGSDVPASPIADNKDCQPYCSDKGRDQSLARAYLFIGSRLCPIVQEKSRPENTEKPSAKHENAGVMPLSQELRSRVDVASESVIGDQTRK